MDQQQVFSSLISEPRGETVEILVDDHRLWFPWGEIHELGTPAFWVEQTRRSRSQRRRSSRWGPSSEATAYPPRSDWPHLQACAPQNYCALEPMPMQSQHVFANHCPLPGVDDRCAIAFLHNGQLELVPH